MAGEAVRVREAGAHQAEGRETGKEKEGGVDGKREKGQNREEGSKRGREGGRKNGE